jgi:hypothetical protein
MSDKSKKRADDLQTKTWGDVEQLRKTGLSVTQALSQLSVSSGIAAPILAARFYRELRKRELA